MSRFATQTLLLGSVLFLSFCSPSVAAKPTRFYDGEKMSSNLVTSLCQDRTGYLWIGTEYGLNKFDGVNFTQYYSDDDDPSSLGDDLVRSVMCDSKGQVWVVSNRTVQRYDPLTDSFLTVDFGGYSDVNVNDMLETEDGKIWVLHDDAGLFEVDGTVARRLEKWNRKLSLGDGCDNMYLDRDGHLWMGFREYGMQMVDTLTGNVTTFGSGPFEHSRALDFTEDKEGRLIVATYTSLQRFNTQTLSFETVLSFPRNFVYRLFKDSDGTILMSLSGNGLWKVDPEGHTMEQAFTPIGENDLSNAKVHAFLSDRNGNTWLGCYQKGLFTVIGKEPPFHFLPLDRIPTNNGKVLRSIHADRSGHALICQEKGGIQSIDLGGGTLSHMMGDYTVMTVYEDNEGTLWVGTYGNGLFRIDPLTGKETWMRAVGNKRIGSITQDAEGNLYLAVFGEGLRSLGGDGLTERVLGGGKLQLFNPYLNTLFTDRDGRIWIGHYYGIDVYDPRSDSPVDVGIPQTLRPNIVYCIGQSVDGSIWVGSNKGLFRYRPEGTWERLTTKDGLPNDNVSSLVMIPDGSVWVGTYRGLAQISADGEITCYYRGNGLEGWSYLRGVSAYSSKGEVLLGNQDGITYFIPGNIRKDAFLQGITLTAMHLGDKVVNASTLSDGKPIITCPLEEASTITLSYQDNTFGLCFSPMDFRDPQNMRYEFRFDNDPKGQWHQAESGRSEIYFSHLSYGNHRLLVRAYDNGLYSPEKQLSLYITPPWYRTPLAYVAYALLLLAVILLVRRYYWNRKQAEFNEERIKFFVDISHELRSPLTLIKSPLSKLLRTEHDPQTTAALRNIDRNADRLLALTNQILSIRKMEKGQFTLRFAKTPLSEFVGDICHDFDYMAEKRLVTLHFHDEAPTMLAWIDPDNFDKVVSNLVGNALKYVGEGGEVDITVRCIEDKFAELEVSDNGPGIDEAQLKKIFERFYQASARPAPGQMSYGIGLNLTQKIVALHNGTITARNRTDSKGSIFTVRLPLDTKHIPQDQLVSEPEANAGHDGPSSETHLPVTDVVLPRRTRTKTTYHVAVVDDDEDIRTFLETELSESYHVQTYPDGRQALEGIVENVPDLVISDVVMPVMDGNELLKRLKSTTATSHIPVILLTTKTDHISRVKGLEEGADAYVDKPFNLEELEARAAGLIANRIRMKGKFSGAQEQADTVKQVELKGNDAALMEKIMKTVNERLDDSYFNVEGLADAVGLSRVQLHRRVKELTGISVGEFIRNIRLQQAARLLSEGDITVSQVAYAVGFANPTHFSAAFKRHFGVTPSEYMAKHKTK